MALQKLTEYQQTELQRINETLALYGDKQAGELSTVSLEEYLLKCVQVLATARRKHADDPRRYTKPLMKRIDAAVLCQLFGHLVRDPFEASE